MRYISTRGAAPVLPFAEAMMTGLARDGGLYVPETVPQMDAAAIATLEGLSYEEAAEICGVAIGTIKSRVNRARAQLASQLN